MRPDDAEAPMDPMSVSFDEDGANFVTSKDDLALLERGEGQRTTQEQFLVLQMLEEQGIAARLPNGFTVASEDVTRLAEDERSILGFPPGYTTGFSTTVRADTTSQRFAINVRARVDGYGVPFVRNGPAIRVGTALYLLSLPSLRALRAVEEHSRLDPDLRTESANVAVVAKIQAARKLAAAGPEELRDPHFDLPLGHLDKFGTAVPGAVGLTVEAQPDGSLSVAPDLGPGIDPDKLERRWHQIDSAHEAGVIRVDDQLILLEQDTLAGARNVRENPHIPADQVQDFLQAPGSFYDADVVDLETSFGVRVAGVGYIDPETYKRFSASGLSWFDEAEALLPAKAIVYLGDNAERLAQIESAVDRVREARGAIVAFDDKLIDISDGRAVDQAIETARSRLGDVAEPTRFQVGVLIHDAEEGTDDLREQAETAVGSAAVGYGGVRREPFPHQRAGVDWMTGLLRASMDESITTQGRVQGAILADDMGLGKTFMTLVALREFMRIEQELGREPRPTLAVLPLALIENWRTEVAETFHDSPFRDIVVLQRHGDLDLFERGRGARENWASAESLDEEGRLGADSIRFSLRVGEKFGESRLDRPGRLVMTTYENLRSYQLSLAQVDWGVVIFDEAQRIKNPGALATRAAKGLKAQFKLLVTGTPVENALLDFWCLMDTAQPGLLGSWKDFKDVWVAQIDSAQGEERERLGRELRELVGPFMLRRLKEDHLLDLPTKTIHSPVENDREGTVLAPELGATMPVVQSNAYDQFLRALQEGAMGRSFAAILTTLTYLRYTSLHPRAVGSDHLGADPAGIDESARLQVTVQLLDAIRDRGEKVIVFVMKKNIQRALSLWFRDRYGLPVRVINGDTQAVAGRGGETRQSLIRDFEARPGFNVIIMSPEAAGVGLTVVGANHAIHLERHWNPAKEAQATDRIYRIGQTRPVHVYLPMAIHPRVASFDLTLDRLLQQKTELKDLVLSPQIVSEDEVAASLGLLQPN